MKTYTILYAEDVPHYGTVEIEANNDAEAIAKAKAISHEDLGNTTIDPDHCNSVSKRIVHIQDAGGNDVAHDVRLDNYSLELVTDEDINIGNHAKELLEALERAHTLLDRISDTLHYEDGLPVTALEARDIEIIYGDAVTELAPIETLIRKARGQI